MRWWFRPVGMQNPCTANGKAGPEGMPRAGVRQGFDDSQCDWLTASGGNAKLLSRLAVCGAQIAMLFGYMRVTRRTAGKFLNCNMMSRPAAGRDRISLHD